MRRLQIAPLVALSLVLTTCSGQRAGSSRSEPSKVETLVSQLPAGAEGVELVARGLRLKKGYQFVKESDSTYAIARMNGEVVGRAHCECWVGVGCIPIIDGILTCQQFPGCIDCKMKLRFGDIETPILRFTK